MDQWDILSRLEQLRRRQLQIRMDLENPEKGLVIWRCSSCDSECAGENVNGMCAMCNEIQLKKVAGEAATKHRPAGIFDYQM